MQYRPSVVFVTGASSGVGAAVVRRFAAEGARVIAAARRKDKVELIATELGRELVCALELDVTDRDMVGKVSAALPAEFAAIDCLVNNAGMAVGHESAEDADLDNWDRMIDTNCRGLTNVTRAVLPGMVRRGRGHVINIGSVAASHASRGSNVYGATKAFVRQFSNNLRSDLHGKGIRVTCIEPGVIGGTEFAMVRFAGDGEKAASFFSGLEALTADDIAEAVLWTATLPPRTNVNVLEVMPLAQSPAGYQFARQS